VRLGTDDALAWLVGKPQAALAVDLYLVGRVRVGENVQDVAERGDYCCDLVAGHGRPWLRRDGFGRIAARGAARCLPSSDRDWTDAEGMRCRGPIMRFFPLIGGQACAPATVLRRLTRDILVPTACSYRAPAD
jgi:hypothetical protein